jgi:hypothetical protein
MSIMPWPPSIAGRLGHLAISSTMVCMASDATAKSGWFWRFSAMMVFIESERGPSNCARRGSHLQQLDSVHEMIGSQAGPEYSVR